MTKLATGKEVVEPRNRSMGQRQRPALFRTLSQVGKEFSRDLGLAAQPLEDVRSRVTPTADFCRTVVAVQMIETAWASAST